MSFGEFRERARQTWQREEERLARPLIVVGTGTCGLAAGAGELIGLLRDELRRGRTKVDVRQVGCIGLCCVEPLVDVRLPGGPRVSYASVDAKKLRAIVRDHVRGGKPRADLALGSLGPGSADGIDDFWQLPMTKPQVRVVLRNCGVIDPDRLDHYVARGGYAGLEKALAGPPEAVIAEITASGLRGRGGGGFPTGRKWELCRAQRADRRYLICNADEGDPGAFMNRSVLEGDPHAVLEGMCIAAYAIGASEGYVYCRAEYPLAVQRLHRAIADAEAVGLLGDRILGSGFSFRLHVKEGAGAFVCGEETALIASIEGKRGMPRARPPFPAERGLFGKPTNINNVETLANVPTILREGSAWFAQFGTPQSRGTKTFALTGKVRRPGLIEVPMGIPLREVVYDVGGGILGDRRLKAVQTGGPSGGCIPADKMDLPIDYERLAEAGSIMGSGGLVVMDEETCAVDLARYFLQFTESESCGKCVPCRLGTRQLRLLLEEVCAGRATDRDIALLQQLGEAIKKGSLCGLGQTAPNPVLTTLRYFREEYLEHAREKRCAAGICGDLVLAPCVNRCPAEVDVPAYVSLVAEGRTDEALAVHLDRNPFPSVCGRVCPHACETRCRRATLDGEAVAIRSIKRFLADHGREPRVKVLDRPKAERKSVAVVGAGPAGLTAAWFLRRLGHDVTVYESRREPGGMMRWGIPSYRLPRAALARDVKRIEKLGVRLRYGWKLGGAHTVAKLRAAHDAVFLSLGAWDDPPLRIPGEDAAGVRSGIEFLRHVEEGKLARLDGDVVVVGGGNTAMDAARTALRLGAASVTVAYRRTKAEMPAQPEEIAEAEEEGIRFEFLAAPAEVLTVGEEGRRRVRGVRIQRMKLGPYDESGRRRPVPAEGDVFELSCRYLVRATGQRPALPPDTPNVQKNGTVRTDRWTLGTDLAGVFAGGDAVLGPATVVEAIAHGRRAAEQIERSLNPAAKVRFPWQEPRGLDTKFDPDAPPSKDKRAHAPKAAPQKRGRDFNEVEHPLSAAAVRKEARRCLRCDYGKECLDRTPAAPAAGGCR